MAGKGKYTTYNTPASDRKSFFEKLFKGGPFAGMDQAAAIDPKREGSPVKMGNDILRGINFAGDSASGGGVAHTAKDGIIDTGDLAIGKVDLTFLGRVGIAGGFTAPDTHEGKDVTWKNPGDPANSYVPDITSPGPGKTDGKDKSVDPTIKTNDIKPNFDPKNGTDGTKSPSNTGDKIFNGTTLGQDQTLGKSGA